MNHHTYLLKQALAKRADLEASLLSRLLAKMPWKTLSFVGVGAAPLAADHLRKKPKPVQDVLPVSPSAREPV